MDNIGVSLEKDHKVEGLFVKEYSPVEDPPTGGTVLMIHGGCHGWWAFEKWGPLFSARGWRVFSLSLRNHTDSYSIPVESYVKLKLKDYTDDALTVARWIGAPLILLGHSMGGLIAQKVAEKLDPTSLVLVSTVGPAALGKMREPYPEDAPIVVDAATARALWFHDIDDIGFEAIAGRLVPESPGVVNDYSGAHVDVDRKSVKCPVLVIGGEDDVSPVHKPRAVADFYGADLMKFPGCGHDVMLERRSPETAEAVLEWLAKKLGGAQ